MLCLRAPEADVAASHLEFDEVADGDASNHPDERAREQTELHQAATERAPAPHLDEAAGRSHGEVVEAHGQFRSSLIDNHFQLFLKET
jgi:hypothetical protein